MVIALAMCIYTINNKVQGGGGGEILSGVVKCTKLEDHGNANNKSSMQHWKPQQGE